MKDEYADAKADLYGAFIRRCIEMTVKTGLLAVIVGDAWMSLKSFEALRLQLLDRHSFASFLHLRDVGYHADAFGANAAFVLAMSGATTRRAPFIRLTALDTDQKERDFRFALGERSALSGHFLASSDDFDAIPGSPIVYWLSERMRESFSLGQRLSDAANLRQGLATADNNRFLRQWWEVATPRTAFGCTSREEARASGARWFPYNKGGEFRRWYGNHEHVVNWEDDGVEIFDFKPRSVVRNPGTYFSPSLSWSDISSGEPAFRRYPAGFIHDSTGHSGFGPTPTLDHLVQLLNSRFVTEVMKVVAPTLHFHIGYVGLVPVVDGVQRLSDVSVEALIESSREDWDASETSWNFERNALIDAYSASLEKFDQRASSEVP